MAATRRCLFGIILASLLAAGLGFGSGTAVAGPAPDGASRLRADGRGVATYTGASGRVSFVTGSVPVARFSDKKKPADVARDFFRAYGAVFGVSDPVGQLKYRGTRSDRQGWSNVSFDQVYEDLGVFGRRLVVHIHDDAVTAVNGDFVPGIKVPTTPTFPSSKANSKARSRLASHGPKQSKKSPDLLVYVSAGGAAHLAWRVTTPTGRPFGFWKTFVDARTGAVLASYDDLHAAKVRKVFNSTGDADCDTGLGAPDCTLPDPTDTPAVRGEGEAAVGESEVDSAYDNTGLAYDYFSSTFGRDSYDNAGHTIASTVHFGTSDFNNAFWCPSECADYYGAGGIGEQLVFGNFGGGIDSLAADPDIVTHEFTHAVTGATAGLEPFGQAGALGESYSDVFAALRASDWVVGEASFHSLARDLTDNVTMNDFARTGYDGGGVHANSLIPSHAAYLLANDLVFGIGEAKTEQIMYRALTQYLVPLADFEYNMLAVYVAAADLYGGASDEAEAVVKAFDAVGVVARTTVFGPGAGDLIKGGTPTTVAWSNSGTEGHTFAVQYAVPSGSPSYGQGFEGTTLPAGFTGGGNVPWATTTSDFTSGARSVTSGAVTHDQTSTLSTTRTFSGAGTVGFNVSVSSDFADLWAFYVDDQLYDFVGGDIPWTHVEYPVPAGTHTFTWIFERDSQGDDPSGFDEVWVDDLSFTNSPTLTWNTINAATAADAQEQAWTTPLVSSGAYRVRVLTSGNGNGLGEAFSAPFTVDATPPTASVTSGLALWQLVASRSSGGTVTFTIPWSGSDALSGIANYDLRWRNGTLAGTYSGYSTIYSYTTLTSFRTTFTGAEGKTLCFGVRAKDGVGNLSNYSGDRCTGVPIDDTHLSRTSGWSSRSGSAYYMGTYAQSTTQGAYLISGSYRAKRIVLIATKCSTCGTIEVYRGSTRLARISLRSSTTRYRQLINIKTYSSVTSAARYKVRVYTSGKLVRIEGLGLSLY